VIAPNPTLAVEKRRDEGPICASRAGHLDFLEEFDGFSSQISSLDIVIFLDVAPRRESLNPHVVTTSYEPNPQYTLTVLPEYVSISPITLACPRCALGTLERGQL
jgi:hypothetical protein